MTGRREVEDATDRFYAALNVLFTGNAQPMKDVWSHADDVTYMGPNGLYLVGWQKIDEEWNAQAAAMLGGRVTPQNLQIVVGTDLAVINCVEAGENVVDGQTETVRIRSSTVFRKEAGAWRVIGHQTDLLGYMSPP